jgi:hypothetical protein
MDAPARAQWLPKARLPSPKCLGALVVALGCAGGVTAQVNPAEESALKAAFTYNFAKFTEWPAAAWGEGGGKLRMCVAGGGNGGAFAQALAGLAGKPPVQGKEVQVVQLVRRDEAAGCHMLVVTDQVKAVEEWLASVQGQPVLTVGDVPQFIERGGMIGLVIEGDRVRFEANIEPAQRGHLKLSSQLLKLARTVKGTPGAKP